MNLQERKELLVQLGKFMDDEDAGWEEAKRTATAGNAWFIPEFIELAAANIRKQFLSEEALENLIERYRLTHNPSPKKVGIVMAGNIPLVGFHDLLCTFITGHYAVVKPSSKDSALMRFMVDKMATLSQNATPYLTLAEMLNGCDAYIATGSNNSSVYFDYYFSRYPNIIRKNRTSVAVLTGQETDEELDKLADDVYQYFGLGCRNVTKIFVPRTYNFERLLTVFRKYNYLINHNKYKNNFDYNLAIHLLNHTYYMSNESLLLIEESPPFSPISQLNYEYYDDMDTVANRAGQNNAVQCVIGENYIPFGAAQTPGLCDFADGVDTVAFLKTLA